MRHTFLPVVVQNITYEVVLKERNNQILIKPLDVTADLQDTGQKSLLNNATGKVVQNSALGTPQDRQPLNPIS